MTSEIKWIYPRTGYRCRLSGKNIGLSRWLPESERNSKST